MENSILNTIIDVSNGDMRKAIMVLQNLKYLYSYKKSLNKPLKDIPLNELKYISNISSKNKVTDKITDADIL